MGTNSDYIFVRDCNSLEEAWDRAGGNNNVHCFEGYSGTLAECEQPRSFVSGVSGSLDDRLCELWDQQSKRDCHAFKHDGGIMFVFSAPE